VEGRKWVDSLSYSIVMGVWLGIIAFFSVPAWVRCMYGCFGLRFLCWSHDYSHSTRNMRETRSSRLSLANMPYPYSYLQFPYKKIIQSRLSKLPFPIEKTGQVLSHKSDSRRV
jgi:hypothetical protein